MITGKENNFISAVLYVRNNGEYVKYFLKRLDKLLSGTFDKYEIICVNDASEDNSVERIKEFAKTSNGIVNIVNMSFYQGRELSMNAGVDLAIGDFVYQFDSIFIDYREETIIDVYRRALEGYDIVSASSNRGRFSHSFFYMLFNTCSGNRYKIDSETFSILSRRAINRAGSLGKTVPYRKAIYAKCGLKMDTIKYDVLQKRPSNDRKQRKKERRKRGDSLILFTDVAYKLALSLTLLMMLATIITASYTIYVFVQEQPIAGWTTTMLLLSGGFFAIFALIAVIIKYLSLIVDLVFKKQTYIIESIDRL